MPLTTIDALLFQPGDVYRFAPLYTLGLAVRTNIEIDDELLAQAMKAAGLKTKKATVEEALRMLVRQHRQKKAIADMAGLGWDGDLDEMREGRGMKSLR